MKDTTLIPVLIGADALIVLLAAIMVLTMSKLEKSGRIVTAAIGYTLIIVSLVAVAAVQLNVYPDHQEWFKIAEGRKGGEGILTIVDFFGGMILICLVLAGFGHLEDD